MRYVRLLSVCALGMLAGGACGDDDDSAPDAGNASAGSSGAGSGAGGTAVSGAGGSAGRSTGGRGGSASDAGMQAGRDGGSMSMADAGPPACGEASVRCNGQCVSADKPASGTCSYYGRADSVYVIAVAPNGDLYMANSGAALGEVGTLQRIPKGGGTAADLSAERYNVENIEIVADTLYFNTHQEASDVHMRMVGRVGRVALPAGTPEVIVSDIPNGVIHVTDTHIYVGAQQIETGLRRYDLDGKNETLLTDAEIMDFTIAGDRVYIIDDSFQTDPVKQMPLAGGELTELGGRQCQFVLGVDADTLYAHCKGLVGLSRTNPTSTPQLLLAGTVYDPVLVGKYIYFSDAEDMYDGPFMIQRVGLADHKVETLATVEGRIRIRGPVVDSDAVYVFIDPTTGFPSKPGAVLRITLP
jgi:Domain of unknown function (DUF5050)